MLGEYQNVVDYEHENVKFMRNLALLMLGRREEALKGFDHVDSRTPHLLVIYVKALAHLVRDLLTFTVPREQRFELRLESLFRFVACEPVESHDDST